MRVTFLPRLRTLLVLVTLVVLALPLAGLLFLRLYESALIRQTESELIAQAAVLSAAFKVQRHAVIAAGSSPAQDETRAEHVPGPLDIARRPGLDLATDPVLPQPPDPAPASSPAALAAATGAAITPVLTEAQGVTLAAIRLTDARGVIVATTGTDLGRALLARRKCGGRWAASRPACSAGASARRSGCRRESVAARCCACSSLSRSSRAIACSAPSCSRVRRRISGRRSGGSDGRCSGLGRRCWSWG